VPEEEQNDSNQQMPTLDEIDNALKDIKGGEPKEGGIHTNDEKTVK
jgi:hypothetical protein